MLDIIHVNTTANNSIEFIFECIKLFTVKQKGMSKIV